MSHASIIQQIIKRENNKMQDGIHGPFKIIKKATTRTPSVEQWQVTVIKNDIVTHHKFESKDKATSFVESKS